MRRRQFNNIATIVLASSAVWAGSIASALSLAELSNADANSGVKGALEQGALAAVAALGVKDGFFSNEKVRIGLPGHLEGAAKLLRGIGQGRRIDELVLAMNRAAEQAVPMAKELLVNAVKSMSVTDAKRILTGGDTAVTQFFAEKTRPALTEKFYPVIVQATERQDLAAKYNRVASKASGLGLVKPEDANIQRYVTGKALDGLFFMIGEEEKQIRRDPVGSGSAIIGKVFGVLK
jgi:hypothetical protein